jgi:NDP-sugar pyrophosphorylase family protein
MRAMILSAGYGTRLWPLTEDRTKPALPILGKPLVGYVAEYLAGYGCQEIVVNLHHRPDSVKNALGDGSQFGVKLNYIEEPVILGTSGALDNAQSLLDQETFVVVNGKIITDIDLNAALETHRRSEALATLILLPNEARERFSVVETDGGLVKRFGGMPRDAESRRQEADGRWQERTPGSLDDQEAVGNDREVEHVPLMFTGIQIMEPRIFDYIPRGVFSHSTTDVYPQAIANGERIAAHVAQSGNQHWYELSTIKRYLEVSLKLLGDQGQDTHLGKRANVALQAEVSNSILWDDVTIDSGASVNQAILGDGVRIPSGELIENAAVVRAALVAGITPPEKALKGERRGENFVVSLTQ